jgi:tripartite-type tricarboxylate transporter receptor subunit TctC
VPTFKEAGLDECPGEPWWGLVAPRGTRRAIVDLLNKEFLAVFSDPKFVAVLQKNAIAAAPTSVEDFVKFIRHDRRIAKELSKVALPPESESKPQH